LLNQVDEGRQPRSMVAVGMVLDRWLACGFIPAG
jgi:hypothetical protein